MQGQNCEGHEGKDKKLELDSVAGREFKGGCNYAQTQTRTSSSQPFFCSSETAIIVPLCNAAMIEELLPVQQGNNMKMYVVVKKKSVVS